MVFAALGSANRAAYGKQRLCGPLGFMIISLLGGVAFDNLDGIRHSFRFRVHSAAAAIALTILVLTRVPSVEAGKPFDDSPTEEADVRMIDVDVKERSSSSSSSGPEKMEKTLSIRKSPRFSSKLFSVSTVLLVVSILTFGTCHGLWSGYYGLFLENVLRASQSQMGATFAAATLGEVIVMFFSGFLHRKLGYHGCLVIVYAAYVVR